MKIRIFALAKELNMDSKDLIEACAKVGIVLKNSALASISPEEKDKVLEYLEGSSQGPSPGAAKPAVAAPVREVPKHFGTKIKDIMDMAPRPQVSRLGQRATPPGTLSAEADDGALTAVADESADVSDLQEESTEESSSVSQAPAVETPESTLPEAPASEAATATTPAVTTPDVVQPAETAATTTPEVPPEEPAVEAAAPVEAEVEAAPAPADQAPAAEAPPPEKEKAAPNKGPLRPEDYIAPHGVKQHYMVARGTVDMENARNQGQKKPRGRPGPVLPNIASLGEFKGPTQAPSAPAQKPDMRLPTSVITGARPLDDILKKKAEDKKKADDNQRGKDGGPGRKRTIMLTDADLDEAAKKSGGKGGSKLAGADLNASRKERQSRRSRVVESEDSDVSRGKMKHRRQHRSTGGTALKSEAEIEPPITVRSLSEAIGRPANMLIKALFARGQMFTINSPLDDDLAMELALECGVDLSIRHGRDLEQELFDVAEAEEAAEDLLPRPPVITILGHVDHGKTTLLDTIRKANVAAGEAGGITQHIAAYQVERDGKKITFVDTPGHAAFSEMRARGANVTDIAVLVVAADDGVMPQTVEAISHAKAAGVPIVVAMNKCDLPGRNEQRVLQDLSTQGILPIEWGGDTEVVRTSGATGQGIDDLLETLLLTAELHDYRANPSAPGSGVCLEAFRDEGRGTVAWLMVQRGTLRVGDVVICGESHGRIRTIYNDRNEEVTEAGPSTPVKVSGLDIVPGPGDKFVVAEDLESARVVAEERRSRERHKALASKVKPRTLEDVLDRAKGGGVRELPLILKADTPGSLEALHHELGKFSHPEVRVRMVHEGVGGVNESDVYLATATGSIIIAFHVVPEERARLLAEREGVEIREYQIIYEVTDHIKLALEGLLRPDVQHVATGRAIVLRTFFISRVGGAVAGCRVLNGTIERNSRIRVVRDHRVLNEYGIASLKREKDDVKEVREGYECGIRLENFNDVKEGDLFEAFRIEEVKRTL